jgi:large subunit ribosomal protein L31
MKPSIHPELHEVTAHCACGHSFSTLSTLPEIKATICSHCHPLFTGEQKFVDTAGRIDKFNKRYSKSKK